MTSRRSRLKAVTNLPVRRKVLNLQRSANETTSVDNLTSCNSTIDGISAAAYNPHTNYNAEKNLNDIFNKNTGNDPLENVNCTGFQKINKNFSNENDISKSSKFDDTEILENSNDLTKTCNLPKCKTDSNSGSFSNDDHNFKLNSVSSTHRRKSQLQTLENNKGNEVVVEPSCTVNYNISNNNNISNNIVKDGFKCYTVLTPQGVTLNSVAEFTVEPLATCTDNYIGTSINDVSVPEEFEEVQIYTEVEPSEPFINNEIDGNGESVVETEPLEPVLTSLTNYRSENEVNCLNYESENSSIIEIKTNSENLVSKPVKKNKDFNGKINDVDENDKKSNCLLTQINNSLVSEKAVSSGPLKVSPDFHSYKQMSNVRRKRARYNDYTKKLADAKREFQKKYEKTKPDRSSLKMIDLIFYNPSSNPMVSKAKFEKKDMLEPASELVNDLLVEEKVDEPELLDCNSRSNMSDNGEVGNTNKMPVPQVKIGLDGEIILDEKSLIIETTDAKKGREGLQNSVPVFEERGCKVSYYRGKSKKTRDWADCETKRFYKALNTIGPDFTLMQKYFPKRSRLELKNKFKREERLNRALIDKALNNPSEFDMTQLEKDLAVETEAEEEIEMRFCRIVKQSAKKPKIKSSLLSREIIQSDAETEKSQSKSFNVDSKRLSEKERNKKEKEFDFVFQKLLMKECDKSVAVLPEISSSPAAFKAPDHGVT